MIALCCYDVMREKNTIHLQILRLCIACAFVSLFLVQSLLAPMVRGKMPKVYVGMEASLVEYSGDSICINDLNSDDAGNAHGRRHANCLLFCLTHTTLAKFVVVVASFVVSLFFWRQPPCNIFITAFLSTQVSPSTGWGSCRLAQGPPSF